jgi:hypothetical protein
MAALLLFAIEAHAQYPNQNVGQNQFQGQGQPAQGFQGQGFQGQGAQGQVQAPGGVFQPPPNSLALDEEGKFEGFEGNKPMFRDSKQGLWLIHLTPLSKVTIIGEAPISYLRPGMLVQFKATIDEEGSIPEPIAEVEVLPSKGRAPTGLFDPAAGDDAKAVRNPEPGEYRLRAKVLRVKEGELTLLAGRLQLAGKAAEDFKAVLAVDDPSLAKPGDAMKVKAWYLESTRPNPTVQRPGQALAEDVGITLAEPPVANKRGR